MIRHRALSAALAAALLAGACSSSSPAATDASSATDPATSGESAGAGIRLVTTTEAADIRGNAPENLVVLDVRTPEEFAEGHLDGAIMVDFYADDFADQLADLDPDVPYLLYCRSGNRSGQTAVLMEELGFTDVADIDGGIVAWSQAGLDIVNG